MTRARPRSALLAALVLASLAGPRSGATAPPGPTAPAALRFAALPWDAPAPEVASRLAGMGFSRAAAADTPEWRGPAFGRGARLEPEYDAESRLIAITLRFEPDERGSAVQRYAALVAQVRRRHGAWAVQVGPGRAVTETRVGRLAVVRAMGERVAATLWTDSAGGAAVVQLARDDGLWLRYEAPGWEERHTASP